LKTTIALVISGLFLAGCHHSELTRAEAKRIIQKAMDENPIKEITVNGRRLLDFAKQPSARHINDATANVFAWKQGKGCLPDQSDVRIATGQFILCPSPINPEVTWQALGIVVPLRTPLRRIVIEVTGITAGNTQNERTVEDIWQFDFGFFSKDIQRFLDDVSASPRHGKATLRLYDDGWRLVELM
jgi:hypothetical protein